MNVVAHIKEWFEDRKGFILNLFGPRLWLLKSTLRRYTARSKGPVAMRSDDVNCEDATFLSASELFCVKGVASKVTAE